MMSLGYNYSPLGDAIDTQMDYWMVLYQNMFNFVILIVLANMVTSIIVDKFQFIREKYEAIEADKSNLCFICGRRSDSIERSSGSRLAFTTHTHGMHSPWSYIFYLFYLTSKPPTERTWAEAQIAERLESKDNSWFPTEAFDGSKRGEGKLRGERE